MKRYLAVLFYCWMAGKVYAQRYTIETMEGHLERISLLQDGYSKRLAVVHQRDTLYLNDCAGLVSAHVLGKNFLEIIYQSHGGNAVETRSTAILTIGRGRLNACLVANSFNQGKTAGNNAAFSIRFHLIKAEDGNLRLMAQIHDESGADTLVTLQFDPAERIFYSDRRLVARTLRIFEPGERERKDHPIHERLAASVLSDDTYYYYKGNWYIELMDDNWSKLSFQSHL